MKTTKRHIFFSWLLLICFIAGQYMVFAHQHKVYSKISKGWHAYSNQSQPHTTVQEKCEFCDAMHHTAMTISQTSWASWVAAVPYHYTEVSYKFVSFSLILSAGRSPPLS